MYTTVNEASKLIAPLTDIISSTIWNMTLKVYTVIDFINSRSKHKELMKIAEDLKIEYPYESIEYIATIIKKEYGV